MTQQIQLSRTKEFVDRFMTYDIDPSELGDFIDDNSTRHGYFYRPFVDGHSELPDGDKFWQPQVRKIPINMYKPPRKNGILLTRTTTLQSTRRTI